MFLLILMVGCSLPVIQSTLPEGVSKDKIIYALPKGMIRISNAQEKGQPAFIIEPVYVPDSNKYYALETCSHAGYDDEIQVCVDPNGLLKAINVTTTSQAGAILLEFDGNCQTGFKVRRHYMVGKK